MKTIIDLEKYFYDSLCKEIQPLEDERIEISKKVKELNFKGIVGLLVSIATFIFFIVINFTVLVVFSFIGFVVVIVLWIMNYDKLTGKWVTNFKESVMEKMVKYWDEKFGYDYNDKLPENYYYESELFKTHIDRYNGDDLIRGNIEGINFKVSELHTEYTTRSKNRTENHTVFKGLFFAGEIDSNFSGISYILIDVAERLFGNVIGNMFQNINKSRGSVVKFDDPIFEKNFVVYSNDEYEIRKILSPDLIQRMNNLVVAKKKIPLIALKNNKIFIAFSTNKSYCEPPLFKTLLDFNIIKEYFEDLYEIFYLAIAIKENFKK